MYDQLPAQATPGLTNSFASLALFVALGIWPLLTWVATQNLKQVLKVFVGAACWLSFTHFLAQSGVLKFGPVPPPIVPLFLVATVLTVWFSLFSSVGRTIADKSPLPLLVGLQGFRLFLEFVLYRAFKEGLLPAQMTWDGRNFDIMTGFTAIPLAIAIARGFEMPKQVLRFWNFVGTLLLINVVSVAILSMPSPIRSFLNDPPVTWVAFSPYVWLPTVFVTSALAGHLMLFRRLR